MFDKSCLIPLFMVAVGLANLTTDKQVDGIAKCLVNAEAQEVASMQSADKAKEAEDTLQHAFAIVYTLGTMHDVQKSSGMS